jgi:hypothetical protein
MKKKPARTANPEEEQQARLDEIVRQGPVGAWALAGVATFIVVAIYLLFYVLAYHPRGAGQRTASRTTATPPRRRPSNDGDGSLPRSSSCLSR